MYIAHYACKNTSHLIQVRILVTHGLSFLPQCDQIIVMADGTITEVGTYSELVDNNAAFAEFLRNYATTEKEEEETETEKDVFNRQNSGTYIRNTYIPETS